MAWVQSQLPALAVRPWRVINCLRLSCACCCVPALCASDPHSGAVTVCAAQCGRSHRACCCLHRPYREQWSWSGPRSPPGASRLHAQVCVGSFRFGSVIPLFRTETQGDVLACLQPSSHTMQTHATFIVLSGLQSPGEIPHLNTLPGPACARTLLWVSRLLQLHSDGASRLPQPSSWGAAARVGASHLLSRQHAHCITPRSLGSSCFPHSPVPE